MRRIFIVVSLCLVTTLLGWLAARQPRTAGDGQPVSPNRGNDTSSIQLPVTHATLFSSGVAHFQREGEVQGNARRDLSFRAADINDLLKSLVLQDLGGGRVSAVSGVASPPPGPCGA